MFYDLNCLLHYVKLCEKRVNLCNCLCKCLVYHLDTRIKTDNIVKIWNLIITRLPNNCFYNFNCIVKKSLLS